MSVRGLEVQYYMICKRKCWLFHHGIGFELEHDRVVEGVVLHDTSYRGLKHDIALDEFTSIDAIDRTVVREVKISSKMEDSDRMQLIYYLYLLKERGIEKTGLLSYPKEKKTVEVVLDKAAEEKIKAIINGIEHLQTQNIPPLSRKPICRSCAYFDYCFADEQEE